MVKTKLLEHKTFKLRKLFKRNDYSNVVSMTFLNKEGPE